MEQTLADKIKKPASSLGVIFLRRGINPSEHLQSGQGGKNGKCSWVEHELCLTTSGQPIQEAKSHSRP